MATKTYECKEFPQLIIAGVCQFINGEFKTSSLVIQSKIEMSQSFRSNTVKAVEIDDEDPIQLGDLTPSAVAKLKKAQLIELAGEMGLDFGDDATRADLIALCSDELRRNEE